MQALSSIRAPGAGRLSATPKHSIEARVAKQQKARGALEAKRNAESAAALAGLERPQWARGRPRQSFDEEAKRVRNAGSWLRLGDSQIWRHFPDKK